MPSASPRERVTQRATVAPTVMSPTPATPKPITPLASANCHGSCIPAISA